MKWRFAQFAILVLLCLLLLAFPALARAAPPGADSPAGLEGLLQQLASLSGIATLITFVVNALKQFGIVHDGTALTWVTGFNLLALVLLFMAGLAGYNDFQTADALAATIAQVGTLVLSLLVQLGVSKLAYQVVKGVPVIGFSYEMQKRL